MGQGITWQPNSLAPFEYVWQVVLDTNPGPITKSEVAAIIVKAHKTGMKPEAIKEGFGLRFGASAAANG